ncbi:4-hydroxythreonine-4-phosphate dehydrogenase PdxA [Asticcacaulis sp.]|uniref:4-hydroxythreonine-4-phosphate dehydrogenase PdxA n=1 Tax=Asticcacaulis sp. TaxID=1872648 RepID=UPI002D123606|nr:4-hydroxythreonine-4-phosphate dehydrogenase PdxA [Asticcacaulis sp.]HTM79537.1 4-hydroxythreonine-4-phosphate dehydrogenase PdxA [Asticcacaulis sp.]
MSLGDPCGIGPELAAKAWTSLRDQTGLAFCVLGDAALLATQGVPVVRVADISETAAHFAKALPVLDMPLSAPVIAGKPDSLHAPHIIDWIKAGVDLCLNGRARALVTCPIAKSVLYATGFKFPGHTEYLAELCRDGDIVPTPVMMLTAKDLRVVLATIHTPLSAVPAALSIEGLVELARITHAALIHDFAIPQPRLVMAGLNPHAGEDGAIGREEIDILKPAVNQLQNESIDIHGPFPADTLFHDEARTGYDAALCLYHDQGLIPLKTLDFWGGVNITLGLPIVRTSPDHGTGFNIAGKRIARVDSLLAAIRAANDISRNRAFL